MVHRRELIAILRRRALVLHLRGRCIHVPVAIRGHLSRTRTRIDSAAAAVIAHATVLAIVDHRFVVHVVNVGHVDVVHRAVVEEMTAVPVSAFVTEAAVSEAVINAAVEADMRSPETGVPEIASAAPAPITGSPQKADLWRQDPSAGHPVVAVNIAIGPVAGRPYVPVARADRLRVNRQHRRRDTNCDAHAEAGCRSGGWYEKHSKYGQEQAN